MQHIITLSFRLLRFAPCPCCGRWGRFTRPVPAVSGPVPAEMERLVPHICRCPRDCTSSVRAITGLEVRAAKA